MGVKRESRVMPAKMSSSVPIISGRIAGPSGCFFFDFRLARELDDFLAIAKQHKCFVYCNMKPGFFKAGVGVDVFLSVAETPYQ